jgi:hypothetical protein
LVDVHLERSTVFSAQAGAPPAHYQKLVSGFGLNSKIKPSPKRKMERRDIYQRKAYAVRRMSLAVMRLGRATSQAEKALANCWVKVWASISRIRQFKLGNGGGNGKGRDQR